MAGVCVCVLVCDHVTVYVCNIPTYTQLQLNFEYLRVCALKFLLQVNPTLEIPIPIFSILLDC